MELVWTIGDKIKQIRRGKNLSLSELADRSGVSKSYLSSIERDIQGNPSIQVLEKICNVLGIDFAILLFSINVDTRDDYLLDPEWVYLLRKAIELGIKKQQFRDFIDFEHRRMEYMKE